uniref:Semenogelin II n=1 Tax=Gorilla gorilla gorilla TaxID=9595 RepID=G3RXV4_GORGO
MKPNIIFVLSLLLVLEKQAAVMGQKGGSKGRLPSESSQFPHGQKGQHYSGQKGKQQTESKGNVQFISKEMFITIILKCHFSPMKLAKIQKRNTIRFLAKLWGMKNIHALKGRMQNDTTLREGKLTISNKKDVSQSSIYSQIEEKAQGKSQKQITIPSQEQEHSQKANKISYQSSSTEEGRLHYGENGVQKDVSQSSIYSQTEEKAQGKSQKQITIPSQEQEHSQKANKISYQSSSTEERRLHYGENGVQKDVSQSSIYSQTEKLVAGKSQIQAPNPKQEPWHGENAKGESGQSTNREQDLLSHEQKGRHQHGSHGGLDIVIIEQEDDSDRHSAQHLNNDRNPLFT